MQAKEDQRLSPADEAKHLLRHAKGDMLTTLGILERQLTIIQTRAQILMSLAGVVITVTGFSGRLIAGRTEFAQLSIVAGVALVLTSAIYLAVKVMRIRWITQQLDRDDTIALEAAITLRNKKTAAYQHGGLLLCAGFVLYCLALAILLLNPEPLVNFPVR